MIAKIRPTVIALALIMAGVSLGSLKILVDYLENLQITDLSTIDAIIIAILGGTTVACTGSLCTIAGIVATDPPPPAFPAAEITDFMRAAKGDD